MYRILIVDDDEHFLSVLKKHFKKKRFKVITADNGKDGLKLAKRFRPDIILVDYLMPVISGGNLLLELKNSRWGEHIPAVLMTDNSDVKNLRDLYGSLAQEIFKKSDYNPDDVVSLVMGNLIVPVPFAEEALRARRIIGDVM